MIFLWHGTLVEKMTKGRPHTIALTNLHHIAVRIVPEGWYVQQEGPIGARR